MNDLKGKKRNEPKATTITQREKRENIASTDSHQRNEEGNKVFPCIAMASNNAIAETLWAW